MLVRWLHASHTHQLFPDVMFWAVLPASRPPGRLVLSFKTNHYIPPLGSLPRALQGQRCLPALTLLPMSWMHPSKMTYEVLPRPRSAFFAPGAPGSKVIPADRHAPTCVRGHVWVHVCAWVVVSIHMSRMSVQPASREWPSYPSGVWLTSTVTG